MATRVNPDQHNDSFLGALTALRAARHVTALTGAGISTDCGIPDFRSSGGLWSVFDPVEYATLEAFVEDPAKAWTFYRALGRVLQGKEPSPAHVALARLEGAGVLDGVVTQNIDGLHQAAGSRQVAEVHGECRHLQCIQCGFVKPTPDADLAPVPRCPQCGFALKPNVVLFGELVREFDIVDQLLDSCDVLLVIGTSAEVYPVAGFPRRVLSRGGVVMEFNLEPTSLTRGCHYFFPGSASRSVVHLVDALLAGD